MEEATLGYDEIVDCSSCAEAVSIQARAGPVVYRRPWLDMALRLVDCRPPNQNRVNEKEVL